MRDRKQARNKPGGTVCSTAFGVLVASAAAAALTGCSHGTATAHGRQAAALAKGTATAGSGIGKGDPVTVVAALLQTGIGQAEQKDWAAAVTTFDDVLAVSPRNVYALYNLGLIDQSTGNTAGADDYYDQAIAVDGKYTPALYNLAITLEGPNPAKALDLYREIVSINPRASTAYLRMAFVYAELGETQDARAAQAKAVAIDPALGKYSLPAKK